VHVFIFDYYIMEYFLPYQFHKMNFLPLILRNDVQVVLHVHHARQPARVDQLVSLLDPKKGTVLRQRPRHLTANQSAIVEVCNLSLQTLCVVKF